MPTQSYGGRGLFGQPSFGDYSGLSAGVPVPMTPEEIQQQLAYQQDQYGGLPIYQDLYNTQEVSPFKYNVGSRVNTVRAAENNPYLDAPPDRIRTALSQADYIKQQQSTPVEAVNQMDVRKDLPPAPNGQMWEFDANSNQYVLVDDPLSNLSNNAPQTAPVASVQQVAMPVPAPSAPVQQSSIIQGMFPEVEAMQRALYQQKQNEAMQAQAMQFASLSPMARAQYSLYMGGQQLGGAIGSALGGKDPQLQQISMRNAIMSQLDQNNPETFFKAARMAYQYGDSDFATKIADAGQKLQVSAATTRKTIAEAEKFELSNTKEQKLLEKFSKLPPNATEADILAIVTEFGSPDKVLSVLQASADKEAQRTARADQARKDNEAKLERLQERIDADTKAAKERGATTSMLKTMEINGRKEIEQIKNEFKQSQLENKSLPPSLIKEEGKDLELIDNLEAQVTTLSPVINNLKIDPITKKAPLELGFVNNRKYELANATGNSTTESRAYANLERAVQAATNLKVSAEKGVQTDKDVLRFANEFLAAYGKNDTQTTFEALDNFVKATETARKKAEIRINKRREAAGVKPFFENTLSDQDLFDKYK